MKQKIAIIFTCFNRKDQSLQCIHSLISQNQNFDLSFYICDDSSTDGTVEAIKASYPSVNIVLGSGNLYWCKGMYRAMSMAVKEYHDFYLMVNDDVDFYIDAIDTLLDTYKKVGGNCGIVGMTISKLSGNITYGGRKAIPFKIGNRTFGVRTNVLITPEDNTEIRKCDFANWNCFLIDAGVIDKVGLISNKYAHSLGDFDYSYRMKQAGFNIFIAPKPIGFCERNEMKNTYYDGKCPRKKRIEQLLGPKGLPVGTQFRYEIRVNGVFGILISCWRYFQYFKCIILRKNIGN